MKFLALITAILAPLAASQVPNEVYTNNPTAMTSSAKVVLFIFPVDTAVAQDLVPNWKLLPSSALPSDYPGYWPDKWPILITCAYMNDIRQDFLGGILPLRIDTLLSCSLSVLYVDRLGNGYTPYTYTVKISLSGLNDNVIQPFVPTLVARFQGYNIFIGQQQPSNTAYTLVNTNPDMYSTQSQITLLPLDKITMTTPGVYKPFVDLIFSPLDPSFTPELSAGVFHRSINLPVILDNGKCARNTMYFNYTYTDPVFVVGNVTLDARGLLDLKDAAKGVAGMYVGQSGYSATAQSVGYAAEDCKDAWDRLDKSALK